MQNFNNIEELYPTPKGLLDKILSGIKYWQIETVLDSSAGKGDIVEYVNKKSSRQVSIDAIEIDQELRSLLKGKGIHVIHDDFLTFETYKRYDLIIMNPPFSTGDEHLMKALEIQKNGGAIICILNAQTIRNPFSNKRKKLLRILNELNADISFEKDAFIGAERSTGVEIAIVKVQVPKKEMIPTIRHEMQRAMKIAENDEIEMTSLAVNDFIKAAVIMYNTEMKACLDFLHNWRALLPFIQSELGKDSTDTPILEVHVRGDKYARDAENKIVELIRGKYWRALFQNERFIKGMTSQLLKEYRSKISDLTHYEFNYSNIKSLQIELVQTKMNGIVETILDMFDELSHQYAYIPETKNNILYYDGWKTNKAWKINGRVVLPLRTYENNWEKYKYYDLVHGILGDLEKVFDYMAGIPGKESSMAKVLNKAEEAQQTKKIECTYFSLNFFKKGTCHIKFKDEELLKKFNIFASQKKGWLPYTYGKTTYQNMMEDEKHVIDSFEGEISYSKVSSNAEKYLFSLKNKEMLGMQNNEI